MRRHHLIEEAKAELDVAYEEVKRAEHDLMGLEFEYNERVKEMNGHADPDALAELLNEKENRQQALELEQLYELQRRSTQRFALVSACFGIVGSIKDPTMTVDLIERLLFQESELRRNRVAIQRHLRAFQKSLRAYMLEDSSPENDRTVRGSWTAVEETLRELGREI
ncbi:hypothetical protein SAMN06265365_105127 [Tistlia consotensis]|uniref:Uncharacterized protein n=1 Tax=Tistlia consotensis USBA 355 TaxID=560819 RepID=A0A1Y6BJY9_9PROT|nr:hypothetical protein [Tistlia consotensis]SMF13528.1 hypothetical protein SAMN05428998_105171 [Tistlia consotensis USBA 355]SNR50416.1 hypothetical protein SAMN06265365_105127 [Tistlia consotensis]